MSIKFVKNTDKNNDNGKDDGDDENNDWSNLYREKIKTISIEI